MSALKNCALRGLLYLPVLLAYPGLHAQAPTLTTEWVAGTGSEVDQVPSFVWLENGTAILDDVRLPASQQTFESLDPVTGKRRSLLNMRQAVDSLKAIEPGADIHGALANKGYIAVAIDNRAATAISKTLENTLAAAPGAGETADLVAGIRWLKSQPWIDGGRVGVWGWSGGGAVTLNLMTRSQEFKAGIAGAPVTDWRFYDSKWGESFLKLPQDNPAAYDSASLIPRARDLHGYLMLMYGTYDDNVHPQNEEAFMNALIAAGKPYQVELFPMRKHGFVDIPALLQRYNAMVAFWEKNL